jgi:zinc protease
VAKPTSAPVPQLRRLRLKNGLDVVLSPERSSPTVAVGMYYRAGFRLEEQGRTGFAHLFEHLMFQGTTKVPKADFGKLITGAGGLLNGSTRHDYTNYFEVLPAPALEMACYIEADRMHNLDINPESLQNQVDVVEEEVRVNVMSQPYGGFSWLWLSQYAFTTYANSHNFYGEFADLEAATVADAKAFWSGNSSWTRRKRWCTATSTGFPLDQPRHPPNSTSRSRRREPSTSTTIGWPPTPGLPSATELPLSGPPLIFPWRSPPGC